LRLNKGGEKEMKALRIWWGEKEGNLAEGKSLIEEEEGG